MKQKNTINTTHLHRLLNHRTHEFARVGDTKNEANKKIYIINNTHLHRLLHDRTHKFARVGHDFLVVQILRQ
jgi:hypothetical protein